MPAVSPLSPLALAMWLHPGEVHLSGPSDIAFSALLPALMIGTAVLYALGLRRLAGAGTGTRSWGQWPAVSFALGWLALLIALFGPVDEGAEHLLWVHMAQHELLMLLAAPLLVLGRPLVVWLWAVPLDSRRSLVAFSRATGLSRLWWIATTPIVAWALHALALWGWHLPGAYESAVQHEGVHLVQHACFLGSAVVFWWSLAHGRHGRLGYGAGVLYVFSTGVHSSVLGALMTFSSRSWYPIYDARAAAEGWAPLVDQQLAGLLMWVPAGLVFIVIGLALFSAWLGESERRVALGRADTLVHASPLGEER